MSNDIFKVFTWNKICSLACLKAKIEEILKNYYFLDQKPFSLFYENKKILNKLKFRILFLAIVFWYIRKDSENFQKNIHF